MLTYADRVKETTTTTGTGTLTLAGAVPGYQSFTAALTTGALVTYGLLNGNAWEVGQGTFTTSGLTLSRTLIASSTGSLLSLSGTSTVFLTVAARDAANLASPPGTGRSRRARSRRRSREHYKPPRERCSRRASSG